MIVTITEYDRLGKDAENNVLPLGGRMLASAKRTTAGAFAALDTSTNFIRVASDTAVELTDAIGNPRFIAANVPEYLPVSGGEVLTIATV